MTAFLEECDNVKILIHLHSFTYDYHLRTIAGTKNPKCRYLNFTGVDRKMVLLLVNGLELEKKYINQSLTK